MRSATKLYAVHGENRPLPVILYTTPAKALLAFLLSGSRQGTFGQTKGLSTLLGQGALPLFQQAKDIQGGKVATELEFLGSTDFYLSEFALDNKSVIRQTVATSIKFIPPPIVRKADTNIDANATLLSYEKVIRQINPQVLMSTYAVDEISSAHLKMTETQRYSINWEIVALSFIAFISLNSTFEKIETDLPKVFTSFLTVIPIQADVPVNIPPSPRNLPVMFVPSITRLPQATPSVVQSTLTSVGSDKFQCNIVTGRGPLAQIICGQLAIGPSWKEVIERNRCTIGGRKIAESLVKVAATRIFSIPEQSIMEPIVNSLDAYQPARKIGKFGMGFFSLLYWVLQDPKATLVIVSSYQEANFVKPCSYRATISNVNGELYVDVSELTTTSSWQTGFQLTLNFGSPLSNEIFDRFVEQLNRLQYVTSSLIIVNQKNLLNSGAIKLRQQTDPTYQRPNVTILVTLNKNFFITDDKATGLPIETFYSTLIVPSISSKTIALSTAKDSAFVDQSRITLKTLDNYDEGYNSFRITIGEVVIVNLKFQSSLSRALSKGDNLTSNMTVLMTLPLQTRVPVSRDDVLLASVLPEVQSALSRLLEADLDEFQDTTYLEEALLAFAVETASSENLEIIKTFLNSLPQRLRDRQLVGVPVLEVDLYQELNPRYITTLNYDQAWLELQLRQTELSSDEFFLNKRVIFADLPQGTLATNGGTSSFIFVSRSFLQTNNKNSSWPVDLAVRYKRDVLYPVGTNFGESLSRAVLQYTETFRDARSRLLMETLAGKYQAALDLREPADSTIQNYLSVQIPVMIQYLDRAYYRLYAVEDFHSIIGSIITMLDNVDPSVAAYGDRLSIRCANAPSVDDLLRVMQISIRDLSPGSTFSLKSFRTALLNGRTMQTVQKNYSDLLARAGQYQTALLDRTVRLAIQRRYLNLAEVYPFSAGYEFNILAELNYAVYALEKAGTEERVIARIFLSLLEDSTNAFQFILGYLLIHVIFRMLSPTKQGLLRVPRLPSQLLAVMRSSSSSSAELGREIATVILSTVTKTFGASPGTAIQTYHRLILNSGLWAVLNHQNIFDAYFSELYRPAVDVYAWMERRINVSSLIQIVDSGIREDFDAKCYRFTLSKLVEFVFQEELPGSNLELFQRVVAFKSRVPARLQIIELAVEAGSSKNALAAKLTELTQNSIDAVRQAIASGTNFSSTTIDVTVKRLRGRPELLIGVSDPVGIPPAGIVALSIPFLSGKQASDIVTGEIGSGFFNVYREALRVLITTTRDGLTTEMLDTPITDPVTKQIVDVDRCATVKQTNLPNGTQILIQSRHSEVGVTDAAIEAISFTKEALGLIGGNNTLTNPIITLNGTAVNIPLTVVYETEFFEFRCSSVNFDSYILTKGVPFAELTKYLTALGFFTNFTWILDQLKASVSLNVKSGVFTPVQTRTKIGLTRHNANLLIRAIIEATFYVILFKIEHKLIDSNEIDQYLQYYSSTAIINQVLPAASGAVSWSNNIQRLIPTIREDSRNTLLQNLSQIAMPFMTMDISRGKGYNLTSLILTSAKLFPDIGKIQRYINGYIETAGWSPETFPGQTIFNIIYRWLVSKKPVPVEMVRVAVPPTVIGPQGTNKPKTTLIAAPRYIKDLINVNHQYFIEIWIETYCRLAQKVIPGWPSGGPAVDIELRRDSPFDGQYSFNNNTITIFYEYMIYPKPKDDGLDYLSRIIEIFRTAPEINNAVLTLETNNPTWRRFFMPKGVIAHELEHYRSKDNHQQSVHGNVRMNLPYGGLKDRVFLLQHHDVMLSLEGFYAEVARQVKNIM
jgi:hypothetical protein